MKTDKGRVEHIAPLLHQLSPRLMQHPPVCWRRESWRFQPIKRRPALLIRVHFHHWFNALHASKPCCMKSTPTSKTAVQNLSLFLASALQITTQLYFSRDNAAINVTITASKSRFEAMTEMVLTYNNCIITHLGLYLPMFTIVRHAAGK